MMTQETATRLHGGSGARICTTLVVVKSAEGVQRAKLRDEAAFLRRAEQDGDDRYPRLLGTCESDDEFRLITEHVPWPDLRSMIMRGRVPEPQLTRLLGKVLSDEWQRHLASRCDDGTEEALDGLYFGRVDQRLRLAADRNADLADLIAAKRVRINGIEYPGLTELLSRVADARPKLIGSDLGMSSGIHCDLHPQNILLSPAGGLNYRLVDPRGYDACDFEYDLAKLTHSLRGYYDLIHEGRFFGYFDLGAVPEVRYAVTKSPTQSLFESAFAGVDTAVQLLMGTSLTTDRILAKESFHFAADIPFHCDRETPWPGIAFYCIAVEQLSAALQGRSFSAPLSTPEGW